MKLNHYCFMRIFESCKFSKIVLVATTLFLSPQLLLSDAVAELNKVITKVPASDPWGIGAELPPYAGGMTLTATFFTPSLQVATQLAQHPNIEAILIGGKVSHEAQIALGADAINTLSQIRADICFLGTGHLDSSYGLSEFDWEVVQLKKAMIRAAKRLVSLTLSAKLNSSQRYQVCPIQSIHTLITELAPDNELFLPYKKGALKSFDQLIGHLCKCLLLLLAYQLFPNI